MDIECDPSDIQILATPAPCDTCGKVVQAMMGIVLGRPKKLKQVFCFKDWENYVVRALHLPKVMRLTPQYRVRLNPVAAIIVQPDQIDWRR